MGPLFHARDIETSLRDYADALDKDRGHSKSYLTIVMRQAADEIEQLRDALDKAWRFERCYQESLGAVWTLPMQERLESLQSAFLDAYQESRGE